MSGKGWYIAIFSGLMFWSSQVSAGLAPADFEVMYGFASQGKLNVISNAVERGMDIDSMNSSGDTGLCVAIRNQDITAYRVFRSLGGNVNHPCIQNIPQNDYNAFAQTVNNKRVAAATYGYGVSRAGGYSNADDMNYRQDYGNYSHDTVSRGKAGYVTYRPEDEPFISSTTMWTIGGVALVGGGIAWALSDSKSDDKGDEQNREQSILDGLHGVGGAPYVVSGNIDKSIVEAPGGEQSDYWGVYMPDNKDIINRDNIVIQNITANPDDSKDHWGAIFSKNGYVYNSGDILVTSDKKYAKGIMSCVLDVYNPNNTACIVDAANPVAGDIYNAGNIKIVAEQSMGIFSSTINKITNTGKIEMIGNDNTGIWILGNGDVYNNGTITMSGSNTNYLAGAMTGIWAAEESKVVNSGRINIAAGGRGGTGIYVKKGSIDNRSEVTLSGGGTGLKIHDGTITNSGNITVKGASDGSLISNAYGIKVDNNGTIENNANVTMEGNISAAVGIYNTSGDVTNNAGAKIFINNQAGNSGHGINAEGSVTNKGSVEINYGTGILGSTVINSGDITANGVGIFAKSNGENSGKITLTGSGNAMQSTEGSLTNSGNISSTNVGLNSEKGAVSNSGTIKSGGAALKTNSGSIDNTGKIEVSGASTADGAALVSGTGTITNKGDIVSNLIGIKGINTVDTSTTPATNIPTAITVNNEGTLTVNNASYAIFSETGPIPANEDGSVGDKMESSLSVTNSGTITLNNRNNAMASAIYASDNGTLTNSGKIIINNENDNVSTIYGMYAAKGTLTNDAGKTITINAYNANKDASGTIIGMSVGEGTATNNGTITINANNAVGMRATYIPTAEELVNWEDGTVKSQIINNGLIHMNGENNIGLQAIGKGAAITNTGTVEIKLPNITEVYRKEGDEVNLPDANKFISLEDGAFYKNAGTTTSNLSLDFDSFGDGSVILAKGGTFEAPELSGTVYADSDIVLGGNADTYSSEKAFSGEDAGLNLKSTSYMFEAGLKNNNEGGKDVVMNRKNFNGLIDNTSAAEFLESNYGFGNNITLFDGLKSASSKRSLTAVASRELGLDFFPNFAKQNLDLLKSLNRNMNENILGNQSEKMERATVGYDYLYRTQDSTAELTGYKDKANTVYGVFDKKYNNSLRYGLGVSFSQYESDYDNNADRKEKMVQIFAPIIYNTDAGQFISTPRVGYGWGDYKRFVDGNEYFADVENFYYGAANQYRHEIDLGWMVFEPLIEFNVLGLYQDKTRENEKLSIDSANNLSVELGLGLYARRSFVFDKDNELNLRIGGTVYHEFADPYHEMTAQMYGMSGNYNLNSYTVQRNRAVLNARADYRYQQFNFYGQFNRYIEDNGGYEVNTGLDYRF